ncbi:hypothetical protein LOCC1_G000990 [Lachnellula occidentalis]|uniref:Uncharacterized protein n=1 Tax=Lachnellula occidentalis TaxID=215460 RepID=A0A8H8UKE8_9HELO|nr:hypothetical protein LOCC1_G000990 [Lachnellula occidentalis]
MSCMARLGNKCLHGLGFKAKERRPSLVISPPFNFQSGPSVNFPGYSEDDISLMREKAIASTAITEDDVSDDDFVSRHPSRPRSRAGSTSFGLGAKMVRHARRFSRSGRGVMW